MYHKLCPISTWRELKFRYILNEFSCIVIELFRWFRTISVILIIRLNHWVLVHFHHVVSGFRIWIIISFYKIRGTGVQVAAFAGVALQNGSVGGVCMAGITYIVGFHKYLLSPSVPLFFSRLVTSLFNRPCIWINLLIVRDFRITFISYQTPNFPRTSYFPRTRIRTLENLIFEIKSSVIATNGIARWNSRGNCHAKKGITLKLFCVSVFFIFHKFTYR